MHPSHPGGQWAGSSLWGPSFPLLEQGRHSPPPVAKTGRHTYNALGSDTQDEWQWSTTQPRSGRGLLITIIQMSWLRQWLVCVRRLLCPPSSNLVCLWWVDYVEYQTLLVESRGTRLVGDRMSQVLLRRICIVQTRRLGIFCFAGSWDYCDLLYIQLIYVGMLCHVSITFWFCFCQGEERRFLSSCTLLTAAILLSIVCSMLPIVSVCHILLGFQLFCLLSFWIIYS